MRAASMLLHTEYAMRRTAVFLFAIIAGAAVGSGLSADAIYIHKQYAIVLFFFVPLTTGFAAVAALRAGGRTTLGQSILVSLGSGALVIASFLLLGKEGIVCVFLALPIALPWLIFGAWLAFEMLHRRRKPPIASTATLILGVVIAMSVESNLRKEPAVTAVADSIVIDAEPGRVWNAILGLDSVPPPSDWIYRAGLACPQRTRIVRAGAGGERRCELSTGELVERIDVWEPGHRLQWTSLSTPPPIRETNPFYDVVDAPHLHGYYTSPRGEFVLERVGPHRTRLTRRTWYSQRLYPAAYWRLWSEMGISHIHDTVLQQVSRGAVAKL
jgi:hypothetical protein